MTNEELDRKMAEVMGWKLTGSGYYIEYTGEGAKGRAFRYVMSKAQWQPTRRIEQAMMVLTSKFDKWLLATDEGGYSCYIYTPIIVCSGSKEELAEAICRAVAAAWEEGGDASA